MKNKIYESQRQSIPANLEVIHKEKGHTIAIIGRAQATETIGQSSRCIDSRAAITERQCISD